MSNPLTSCTTPWINVTGLAAVLAPLLFFWPKEWTWEQQACLAMALATAPIIVLETLQRLHRREWPRPAHPLDVRRALGKYAAFLATLAVIAFLYWVLPHYHGIQYGHFFLTAKAVLPWMLPLALPYFLYMDRITGDAPDGYSELAALLTGTWKHRDWPLLGQYALGWTVKAFFLPLMFLFIVQNLNMHLQWQARPRTDFLGWYLYLAHLTYLVDVIFATAGYVLTIRLLGSHIRSTEPTMLGWVAALACYQPFWNFLHHHYLNYGSGDWARWLEGHPVLYVLWGGTILLLLVVYTWATVCFGIRFSNLTWRGLIAHGPYAVSKHPAYLTKNLSWWLISIPFAAAATWEEGLRFSVLLLGLGGIYFLRAWTEERHLANFPEYRDYCRWMARNSPLRFLPFPTGHWKGREAQRE